MEKSRSHESSFLSATYQSIVTILGYCGQGIIRMFCLSFLGFVPVELFWVRTAIAMIATFGIVLSFATCYIYSTELFPTRVRNAGVGSSSMFARIGSMVAPFAVSISTDQKWLSPVILGITAIIAAIVCLKLPETLGSKLPEAVEDIEKLKRIDI